MRPALQILAEDLADVERTYANELLPALSPREMAAREAIRFLSVAELAALPAPTWTIEGVLVDNSLAALIGQPQTYKSFVALSMGLSIAVGLDWYGRPVRRGVVAYIVGEGNHGIAKRIEAWRVHNRLPDVGGIYVLPRAVKLSDPTEGPALVDALLNLPEPPVAVFVDTVQRTFVGNENTQEDMGAYVTACDRIREATGAAVVLVHHTGWQGERSRGSNVLPASLDTELTVKREDDQVTITATKQKDAPDGVVATLESVPIAGSLALAAVEPRSTKLSKNERRGLAEVQERALKWTEWMQATGLSRSSLLSVRNRLRDLGYVKDGTEGYSATDAGRLALGSRFSGSSTGVQNPRPGGVQNAHTPKGVCAEPGTPDAIPEAA